MTCQDFTDYVDSLLPTSSESKRWKAACMLMHMISLMRSFDRVELHKVRSSSGKTFSSQIVQRQSITLQLASALNIKSESLHKAKATPDDFKRWACELGVDVAEVQSRHEELGAAVDEICVQTLFVRVARTVMYTMHEDNLRSVDRGYHGHCHPSYVQKSWLFGKKDQSLSRLQATQLPGARAPRAVAHLSADSFGTPAPDARSAAPATRRAPAHTSGVPSASRPARRTAHPYARPAPASRQPVPSAPYADMSRAPRRPVQRPMYATYTPTYIPTQHQYGLWHPTNTQRTPHPGCAY